MNILTFFYSIITKFRNYLYDHNFLKVKSLNSVEIICIGNITAGGTGKTPTVAYFVQKFINKDKKVVVISRGYKGKRKKEPLIVHDGIKLLADVTEAGDEAYMNAKRLKIPVVVAKNRYKACIMAVDEFAPDIIILDDGFQHRKLFRDKDIVLIDATNPFGGEQCLPKGRLREPVDGLKRADEIIITKSNYVSNIQIGNIISRLKEYRKKISVSKYMEIGFYNKKDDYFKGEVIENKKVLLFSGIASPVNFRGSINKYSPKKIEDIRFQDHYDYSYKDIENIINKFIELDFDYIITTEKDFVKIEKIIAKDSFFWKNLLVLKMEVEILEDF